MLSQFLSKLDCKFEKMLGDMRYEFQQAIQARDSKILTLETELFRVKERLEKVEERIEDNESYERRDCLVFSGAKIPPHANNENCVRIIQELARNNLKISIPENEISVAHNVGTRNPTQSGNKRSIIAKFCRRNTKMDVLSSARKMKIYS